MLLAFVSSLHGVQSFIGHNNIVCDQSSWYECALVLENNLGKICFNVLAKTLDTSL